MNNEISVGSFIDLMFTSYYNESGAYAAGIINKETAVDNFDKDGENILDNMNRHLLLLDLSVDHLKTLRAMKDRLLIAIEQLP